jgi:hypothetical protein
VSDADLRPRQRLELLVKGGLVRLDGDHQVRAAGVQVGGVG